MTGVQLTSVSKDFTTADGTLRALDSVDLDLPAHSFTSIIGASGCGKSTLIRLLADLDVASSGEVSVLGQSPHELRRQRRIGMVFQDPALLPWRTVTANIAIGRQIARQSISDSEMASLVRLVGLSGFEKSRPAQLSGGMKQRVALARAIAANPELLLLDEPFGALDDVLRIRLNLEVERIWARTEATAVMVTHSINEAVLLSDKVVVMAPRPGRVIDVVDIDLPRPRSVGILSDPHFSRYCEMISAKLFAATSEYAEIETAEASA